MANLINLGETFQDALAGGCLFTRASALAPLSCSKSWWWNSAILSLGSVCFVTTAYYDFLMAVIGINGTRRSLFSCN